MARRYWLTLAFFLPPACGGDEPPGLPGQDPAPCDLSYTYFRIVELEMPVTPAEAMQFGIDLDPPTGHPDNYLGVNWAELAAAGVPLLTSWSQPLSSTPWLVAAGTCPSSSHARVTLVDDVEEVTPGVFRVDQPIPIPAVGTVGVGGTLTARNGTGSIPLTLPLESTQEPVMIGWVASLELGADVVVSGDMLSGTVGFGVLRADAELALRDPLARAFSALIAMDPGCPTACEGGLARDLLALFDDDGDGQISAAELDVEPFRALYVSPDLDLLASVDGELVYWPRRDNVLDHVSMAMRVEAQRVEVVP